MFRPLVRCKHSEKQSVLIAGFNHRPVEQLSGRNVEGCEKLVTERRPRRIHDVPSEQSRLSYERPGRWSVGQRKGMRSATWREPIYADTNIASMLLQLDAQKTRFGDSTLFCPQLGVEYTITEHSISRHQSVEVSISPLSRTVTKLH